MIFFLYGLFAILSITVNLLFQFLTDLGLEFLSPNFNELPYFNWIKFYASLLVGTLAGLVVKYVLDKRYIFYHVPESRQDDAKKFIIYSLMGISTTVIFWGAEISFYYIFESNLAKYVGGALGLCVGYAVKYQLDKKYVFVN